MPCYNGFITLDDQYSITKEGDAAAVITLNTKKGVGLTISKGIITLADDNIQTSLPVTEEIQGSYSGCCKCRGG